MSGSEQPPGALGFKVSYALGEIPEEFFRVSLCSEVRYARVTRLQGFDSRFEILILVCISKRPVAPV